MGERQLPIHEHAGEEIPSLDELLANPDLQAKLISSSEDNTVVGVIIDGKFSYSHFGLDEQTVTFVEKK